jgi:hypothetical protein
MDALFGLRWQAKRDTVFGAEVVSGFDGNSDVLLSLRFSINSQPPTLNSPK